MDSFYASLEERERGSDMAHKLKAFTIIERSLGYGCELSPGTLFIEQRAGEEEAGLGRRTTGSRGTGGSGRIKNAFLVPVQTGLAKERSGDGDGGLRICATQGPSPGPGCSGWVVRAGASPHRCFSLSLGGDTLSPAQMGVMQRSRLIGLTQGSQGKKNLGSQESRMQTNRQLALVRGRGARVRGGTRDCNCNCPLRAA